MIKDTKGRKWSMRFKQYKQGWHWEARHKNTGQESGMNFFKTRALAEEDARLTIQSFDHIAWGKELGRRLQTKKYPMPCQLTEADWEAIDRAGRVERARPRILRRKQCRPMRRA
jgi:hypothetical protein